MKKCPYSAEEIQEEAIKFRNCGEMLVKKRSPFRKVIKLLFGIIVLIASLGDASFVWLDEHVEHGHSEMLFEDPNHLLSLLLVLIGAFWTWRNMVSVQKKYGFFMMHKNYDPFVFDLLYLRRW